MKFGTGGIPFSTPEPASSEAGVREIHRLGLTAMELEFVHGCRMKAPQAQNVGAAARQLGVSLSCHASYYLNLLSPEKPKLARTHKELLTTGEVQSAAGGGRVVFHPGFYLNLDKAQAYRQMRAELERLADEFKARAFTAVLAPEVTGKHSAFGTVDELYALAADIGYDKIRPCIDWSHVHARANGALKTRDDYARVLDAVEKHVGKPGLKTLHCHVQSVKYSSKGELSHLPFSADDPPLKPLIQTLIDYQCDGTLICESPLLEKDALHLQKTWRQMGGK